MAPQIVAQAAPTYLSALGSVAAFYTVTVKPRVDGQLMSLGFREGDLVQAGQVLASIDPRPYRVQLAQAEGELAYDRAQLAAARDQNAIPKQQLDSQIAMVAQLEGKIKTDQAKVESAKLQLTYAQVTAPITGIVGLRMIDLGNIVHAADAGIVTIAQVQPIAVVFTISEDSLPRVLARLRESASMPVEAWNRDATAKIATGHLMAVDNQIDPATGTVKLKAVFDNKDGALFPNQFVNVRLLGNSQ
jgi:multidrug efflux system membrane fusion protein